MEPVVGGVEEGPWPHIEGGRSIDVLVGRGAEIRRRLVRNQRHAAILVARDVQNVSVVRPRRDRHLGAVLPDRSIHQLPVVISDVLEQRTAGGVLRAAVHGHRLALIPLNEDRRRRRAAHSGGHLLQVGPRTDEERVSGLELRDPEVDRLPWTREHARAR